MGNTVGITVRMILVNNNIAITADGMAVVLVHKIYPSMSRHLHVVFGLSPKGLTQKAANNLVLTSERWLALAPV